MNKDFTSVLFIILCGLSVGPSSWALTLTEAGKTSYEIVVGDDAPAPEKTAAGRLQYYLREVTGAEFPIVPEAKAKGLLKILVGPSKSVKTLLPDLKWETLGRDGIVIKTVGNDLVLAGGRPRGTLYAVFTFLEDTVGCRWWTSDEHTFPKKPTLTVGDLDTVYVPALISRDQIYRDVYKDLDFQIALKLNGNYNGIPENYGGHVRFVPDFAHTFYKLLPPDKYFATHPEWYSLLGGKRSTQISQLCLTNPGMQKEMIRVVLQILRDDPTAQILSITQNDAAGGQCECEKCRALEAKEGSPSGPLIHFVNAIAETVGEKYPKVLVETFAYQFTRTPPKYVRPRSNVIIRLCAGQGCCYDKPFDSEFNRSIRGQVHQWSRISKNLFIWDYVTNFTDPIVPHPNLRTLAPNIRFLVKNHAIGLFLEGAHVSTMSDLVRLRVWLQAHLMWRPDADEKQLIAEFMKGYYGPAGPSLIQYIDLVHDSFERAKLRLYTGGTDVAYLTLEEMNRATRLFDAAEKAVAGDPVLLARVQRERVTLTYLWVLRYSDLKKIAAIKKQEFLGPKDPLAACDQMRALAEKYQVEFLEGYPLASRLEKLKATTASVLRPVSSVPPECKNLAETQWLDVQNGRFFLQGGENVDDKLASDGSATRMGGAGGDWLILCPVSSDWLRMYPGKWHVYAVVRTEVNKMNAGLAFRMGIFDYGKFKDVVFHQVGLDRAGDGKYHTYDLGVHQLNPNCGFYFAPGSNPEGVKASYVDRIFMVPVSKP